MPKHRQYVPDGEDVLVLRVKDVKKMVGKKVKTVDDYPTYFGPKNAESEESADLSRVLAQLPQGDTFEGFGEMKRVYSEVMKGSGIPIYQLRLPGLSKETDVAFMWRFPNGVSLPAGEIMLKALDVQDPELLEQFGSLFWTFKGEVELPDLERQTIKPFVHATPISRVYVNDQFVFRFTVFPASGTGNVLFADLPRQNIRDIALAYVPCRGTFEGQLRRYLKSYGVAIKHKGSDIRLRRSFTLIPPVDPSRFSADAFFASVCMSGFHNPRGSYCGPVFPKTRDFVTEPLEAVLARDFLRSIEGGSEKASVAALLMLKASVAKPKVEVYKRSELKEKTRSIFAQNAFAYLPLSLILSEPARSAVKFDPEESVFEQPFLYGIEPKKWIRLFLTEVAKDLDVPRVFWWYYSDNLYALKRTPENSYIFYSFDGKRMESSITKDYVRQLMEFTMTPTQFSVQCILHDYPGKPLEFAPVEGGSSSTLFTPAAVHGTELSYNDLTYKLYVPSGAEVRFDSKDSDVCTIRYRTGEPTRLFKEYMTLITESACDGLAYFGIGFMPVNFMSSGVPYTTLANSFVSGDTAVRFNESAFDPEDLVSKIREAPDQVYSLPSWRVTCESVVDITHLVKVLRNEEELAPFGYFRLDMLGFDVVECSSGLFSTLRLNSLVSQCFYHKYQPNYKLNPAQIYANAYAQIMNGAFCYELLLGPIVAVLKTQPRVDIGDLKNILVTQDDEELSSLSKVDFVSVLQVALSSCAIALTDGYEDDLMQFVQDAGPSVETLPYAFGTTGKSKSEQPTEGRESTGPQVKEGNSDQ